MNLPRVSANDYGIRFLNREPFTVGISSIKRVVSAPDLCVPVDSSGENFREHFQPIETRKVTPIKLRAYTLNRSAKDQNILNRGKFLDAVVTLEQLLHLVGVQIKGDEGPLLVKNEASNIFYLCSTAGVLLRVSVRWVNFKWVIGAYPFPSVIPLHHGSRVFLPDGFKVSDSICNVSV